MKILNKYPINSLLGEYKVDIRDCYYTLGLHYWEVNIYVVNNKKLKINKFKNVYSYETSTRSYREWIGKYIELAIEAVNTYEDKLIKEEREYQEHLIGMRKFEEWNGNVN